MVIDFRLFFTGIPSNMSIRSRTVTTVAYISIHDFLETLKQYNFDYVNAYIFAYIYI
jgi:hypothetical protein